MVTRDVLQFVVFYIVICIGSGFFALLFFGLSFWGFLGISFLIIGIIGILDIRRRGLALKRTNPELFEKLRAEAKKRAQERRAREIHFSDYPAWMIVVLTIMAVFSFAYWVGLFQLNNIFWAILISVLMFLFLIYYFVYQIKITKKKKKLALPSQN
jgi:membrane associated rhomboid family serine protease